MKKIFLLMSFAFFALLIDSQAQNSAGQIKGSVIDGNARTIESSTIALLKAEDSSVVKISVADKSGNFSFEGIKYGKYLVMISAVGHNKGYSSTIELADGKSQVSVGPIELVPAAKSLGGVTVTSRRPLIEQKIDRTVVNVEASATNVGATALEVLEKSPGITVDKDGNISLKGKQGVQVYIDGRPSYLSGADLASLLGNMNSSQLDQIEIMTNPPAKYEAVGNSGIINIKTKKTKQFGYSGSFSSTYSQGQLPKISNTFNFNYRKNKVNVFANLSQSYRRNMQDLDIQRKFMEESTKEIKSLFEQESDIRHGGESYNAKAGLDFSPSKKTTMGFVVNGFIAPQSFSNTSYIRIYNPLHVQQSLTVAKTSNENKWKHGAANLNFRHVFDSTGKEMTADADYILYRSRNNQDLVNAYYTPNGLPTTKADTLLGFLPQDIDIFSAKLDYTHPLKNQAKFEAGAKTSWVKTDNNAIYDSLNYGVRVPDIGRTNHFIYEENVNAVYANYSQSFGKKFSGQLGLRMENTNAEGKQLTTGQQFKRNYTQLFPTAYVQYKANEKHSFVLNYGRRLERPDYADLNPFIIFLDKYTSEQGNPDLKPQFSHNIELTHTYKGFLNTTLNYTRTTDIIDQIIEQDPDKNEAKIKKSNISRQQQFGIAVSAGGQLKKWWTANLYANLYRNRYEGVVNGENIDFAGTSVLLNAGNQFKFGKSWSAELGGFYRSKGMEGVFNINGLGMMNVALSKQIFKGKGSLRLNFRDILWTQKVSGTVKYGTIDAAFQQQQDSRQIAFGFTYRFSKGKMNGIQKRKTGSAEEEMKRVKTGDN